MKRLPMSALLLPACAALTPGVDVSCPGHYCVTLEVAGIPGSGELCYATATEREQVRTWLARSRCQLDVVQRDGRDVQRARCPGEVAP